MSSFRLYWQETKQTYSTPQNQKGEAKYSSTAWKRQGLVLVNIYHGTNEDGSGFLGSCEVQEASVRQSLEVESNRCLGENGEKVEERRSREVGGSGEQRGGQCSGGRHTSTARMEVQGRIWSLHHQHFVASRSNSVIVSNNYITNSIPRKPVISSIKMTRSITN